MKQWLNQHAQALRLVLGRMRCNSLATLMMCGVIGVTLCLPGILYVIVDNLNRLTGDVQSEPQISLFLKLDISKDVLGTLDQQLRLRKDIKSYHFVGKDTAWQQLQINTGVASSLEKNPLPDAYFVHPRTLEPAAISQMQQDMQQWPGVELAQIDADWVKRLYALLELGKKAILVLGVLLGLALLTIIGNTIRLQIVTQREEVEVSKLIGATNGFIRRPFLYAGALYGICGGLAAWAILAGVIALFNYSVAGLADLYESNFRLGLPDDEIIVTIVISAVVLG